MLRVTPRRVRLRPGENAGRSALDRLARGGVARRGAHSRSPGSHRRVAGIPVAQHGGAAMKMTRRLVVGGIGGALLGLPWLEGLRGRRAWAQSAAAPPFAIFFRQANGVAAAQDTNEIGREPERFWPTEAGPLTPQT